MHTVLGREATMRTPTDYSEFFPKRIDLAKITEHELFNMLWLINNRPRKYLVFKTPFEVFMYESVQ